MIDRSRRTLLAAGIACVGVGASGCRSMSGTSTSTSTSAPLAPAVIGSLAPTGKLRASINLGNPILASRGPDGQPRGVSVDLARTLAQRLGVPVEFQVFDAAAKSVAAVTGEAADIGFFAIDPLRGQGVRFTAAYVVIEGAYLVRDDSPLTDNGQVDRAGTRVTVGRGSAYDLFLTRELKAATLERAASSPAVVDTFIAQHADVAAGVRQQLESDAKRLSGLRLLPGRFMEIRQAMGLPASRGDDATRALAQFVEDMKANGFVAAALQRHGIEGAVVAAPGAGRVLKRDQKFNVATSLSLDSNLH